MTMHAAACALLLALVIGGCGGAPAPTPRAVPATTPPASSPSDPPVPPDLQVENPKDARGSPPCELLTDAQLVDLGLLPETGESDTSGCTWQLSDDPLNLAGAGVNFGLTLAELYTVPERFDRFGPVSEVADHPAIRADLNTDNSCALVIALGGDQLLGVDGNVGMRPVRDPCALPRRMAELILSNLPPQG